MSDQLSLLQEAAARSVARQEKRKEEAREALSPTPPEPGTWEGVVKRAPDGKLYRLYNIHINELPAFLEKKELEVKSMYYYAPEKSPVMEAGPKKEEGEGDTP